MQTNQTIEYLQNELEAVTRGLQHQVTTLKLDVTKLHQMVNGLASDFDHYQYSVWTKGEAAAHAVEIASLLSRQGTLQKALHLLERAKEESEREGIL